MTDEALVQLIQASPLLSQPERMYWMTTLPKMTATQKSKLSDILQQAANVQWDERVGEFVSTLNKALTPSV